ncbi:MAG: AraC family transcriptional regulator [Clostridiaceae bacterium]|uniref:AraC family transcriptional regulator n=1 Tax=Clostridium porci TaxID=2605778 RepID=A0A7X2NIW6_9CLOT|nr:MULTISPECIES: AraC family transcriptional regulator [Clostridium]MCI6139016.1 AraC family transcriptional regulator [Clostridium sp.]MDY3231233.1 AraC family transcriptional regulator [Clostridiaceae bacterium]MSS35525.1 AraC family transcriptional regulator [Clostridium porci]
MHAWEAIQRAVNYIEENLQEEISTEMLAEMVSLSPFYFQRLFKRLVNKPVQEYIKLRRLSKAITQLNTNDRRILDISLEYGFSSHANFTRAFKETFGITPEEYKKTHPMLNTVIKPEISMNYVLIDEGVPLVIDDIVLEIHREKLASAESYIGLVADVKIATQTPVGQSTGIDVPGQLWTRFHKEKAELAESVNPAVELGMSYMADSEKGIFKYFAGVLLQGKFSSTNDFITQELPAGNYIICKIEAEDFEKLVTEALDKAGKYFFGTWLPNHCLTFEPFSAEKYYTDCDCGNCMEIWVKILD